LADSDSTSILSSYYSLPTTNYDTVSGSISFTGLGSGTDFSEIVDQLVEIESIHKTRLEAWKATWEAKISSMEALNQRLEAIEEAAGAIDSESEFMARTGSTSDYTVVTATASNDAKTGAYHVEVGTDVKHILRSVGIASATTDVVSGDGGELGFYIGTSYTTVGIGATDDLDTIAAAINAKLGSTVATVENDGTSSNPYHLVFKSTTGGNDGRIQVVKNATDLSFGIQDVVLDDDSSWGSASINLAGQFTGDKSSTSVYEYIFTAHTSGTTITIGSEELTLTYDVVDAVTGTTLSSGTTLTVSATYNPGDAISVDNGYSLRLGAGDVLDAESFSIRGFANDIDDAESTSWSGTTITTSGNYLGSVNKTYSFTVMTGGTLNDAGTEDTVVLRWTDSSGRSGTVSLAESNNVYTVDQGVKLSLAAGDIASGDTFSINVFAPDQQQGQDKGLAQATKVVHSGWVDELSTEVTSSDATFTYVYAGKTITVAVDGGSTLTQLKNAINNDSDNPGVVASIINDGQGLPDSYKLVLTGEDTGAQYQITSVSHTFDTTFGSGGELGGGFTRSQWATNSMIKVDGYPSETDIYLQRDTNQIDEVITGVTLNLHDAGEAEITISNDIETIYSAIEAFINAVNYAQSYIREATKFDEDGEETGILIGNYSYYILKSRIDSALNAKVSGLVDGTDPYLCLADIGIVTDPDADGAWVIKTSAVDSSGVKVGTTLREALAANPEAVANLFISNTEKGSTGVAARTYEEMLDLTDSSTGTLNVLIKNYNTIVDNIDEKIEKEETRIETYRQHQLERFARLETTLSTLNSESAALESALAQLPNSSSD
jgi:flagellar hook-associated protein 2